MEVCDQCGKSFPRNKGSLYRHIRNVHKIQLYKRDPSKIRDKVIQCALCDSTFACRNSLYRHTSSKHKVHREQSERLKQPKPKLNVKLWSAAPDSILCTLPEGFDYVAAVDDGGTTTRLKFPVTKAIQAIEWKANYEAKNKLFFRKGFTRASKKESVMYKQKFCCGHNVKNKNSRSERQTYCPFELFVTCVKEQDTSLTTKVRLIGKHNHDIGSASSVKFRPVSAEVQHKFLRLFNNGYTPARALQCHAKDLKDEYGDEFYKIESDRFYYPDINWVYRLHGIFKKEFEVKYGLKMLQNSTEEVNEFKHDNLDVIDATDCPSPDNANLVSNEAVHTLEEQQCIDAIERKTSAESTDTVLKDFDTVWEKIRYVVTENPQLKDSVNVMVSTFSKIKTTKALESAMNCFGKYSSGNKKLQTRHIPTSVAGSRRLRRNCGSGGPLPKNKIRGDHSFARTLPRY